MIHSYVKYLIKRESEGHWHCHLSVFKNPFLATSLWVSDYGTGSPRLEDSHEPLAELPAFL
jgi:hypothetical protein